MKSTDFGNRLVMSLSAKDRKRLLAIGEQVDLTIGAILQEPGERIRFVYFPVAGMISLLIPVSGRGNLEVGLVGKEGFLGIPVVLGVDVSPLQGLVQGSGAALRISAPLFRRALASSSTLQRTMNWYAYVFMTQLAETPGCVKFHFLEARLARWLLMTHDRAR
jgi:CRP-like cAMP-binding protein